MGVITVSRLVLHRSVTATQKKHTHKAKDQQQGSVHSDFLHNALLLFCGIKNAPIGKPHKPLRLPPSKYIQKINITPRKLPA
jgi:hypothetical protein